jgi:hypothetical protein
VHNFCTEGESEPEEPDRLPFEGDTKDTKETKDTKSGYGD